MFLVPVLWVVSFGDGLETTYEDTEMGSGQVTIQDTWRRNLSPSSNYLSFDSALFQMVMRAGVLVVGQLDIALVKMYEYRRDSS
jgi:hypothetical protein